MKKLGLLALLFISVCFMGCAPVKEAAAVQSGLTVKVLDVGQGDAILIETPTETVMIDTGDVDERDKLRQELKSAGVSAIHKVILSHPHADHIGGMEVLLKEFAVKEVYDNGMVSTSPVWRSYMKILKEQGINRQGIKAGDVLDLGGGVKFAVYYPSAELVTAGQKKGYKHDPNNESVAGKLTYKNFSMLFTGDGEKAEEQALLTTYESELKSDVLKAPHHGSKTSSSPRFLRAVKPEAVIISCGQGNEYGHPHDVTLNKYDKGHYKVYRTDLNGTVTITATGESYDIRGTKP